jgi:flagellar FliL protein
MASKDKKEAEDQKEQPAEGADGAPAEGEAGAKKGMDKKKLILFIAAPILLLVAVGAGLFFTGILDGLLGKKPPECAAEDKECLEKAAKAEAEGGEDAAHGEKGEEGGGEHGEGGKGSAFLPIPTMIVNLASDDGTPRYLRLTVQLEMKSEEDKKSVEAVIPRVIDQFQTYLRELRVKDLRGSAGIYRLQMELLWRVNQAAAPVEVKDVLFQEILLQ